MGHVHLGPELAHAARHQVRVAVEVLVRLERGELAFVLPREDAQVLGLPLDDRVEHRVHARAVGRRQGAVGGQAVGQPLEERALRGEGLRRGGGAHERAEGFPVGRGERGAQRFQVDDARGPGNEPRIRDGVGGAREEVREPDGRPHRPGQDREREIERSTDPPEERGGEIASGHGG